MKFNESEFGILKEPSDGTNKLITIELSSGDNAAEDTETTVWQSARERCPPNHLGEWVTIASEDVAEPTIVPETLSGPDAEQQQEMDSLHKHGVWNLTELPEGQKVKVKYDVKYNVK